MDTPNQQPRVGYVLKMYPRFSETFIVNEILAHEAAGLAVDIFSLRPPVDGRFHEALARVRAEVTYLPSAEPKACEFWVGLGTAGEGFEDGWARLREFHGEQARDVHQALLLARAVRARGITHLHAHFGTTATTVARVAARLAEVPYSFTAHAKDIFHESVLPDDLGRKLADAQAAVTVSDYNLAYLRETYGAAAGRVRRIYNGLDLRRFTYAPPVDRPPQIVTVGRLVEKKGFADLVSACAVLAREGRAFRCSIVGSGPLETELRRQIESLGLTGQVSLLGPRTQEEVMQLVGSASVFAAPCVVGADGNRDGLPTVLLEAMALGTPCVSTDVTGIPEILHDGDTGLMVSQHAPRALASALARLLDDASLRLHLAAHARRLVEERFDIHRNAAEMRSLFA